MNFPRAVEVLRKDLLLSPRSPIFLYAIIFPVAATFLVQVVFGSLFEPQPRLGILDRGHSQITRSAMDLEGIEVTEVRSRSALKEQVEGNDLDAGLVLADGFDTALLAGERPKYEFYVGGESLASNRLILNVTSAGLVRDVVGAPVPVEVDLERVGDEDAVPVTDRVVPLLVVFAVIIAGLFVPAAGLVEEKERGTLSALMVTPTQIGDVLAGKSMLAFLLAIGTGLATLALNGAFGAHPVAFVIILVVAALMMLEIGLILGATARDTNMLFSVIKGGNLLLMGPAFFYIWPSLPQWAAKLFPTYYFLRPMWVVAMEGAGLGDIWLELVVALAICVALVPVVMWAGRRMEARLASS